MRNGGPDEVVRTVDVHGDNALPLVGRNLPDPARRAPSILIKENVARRRSGIVDQDVQTPEVFDGTPHRGLSRGVVSRVGDEGERALRAADGYSLLNVALKQTLIKVYEGDSRAGADQT